MTIYSHPTALVKSRKIGDRTRIQAFTHILENAQLGEACYIGDHVLIEDDVKIGNFVKIQSGVKIYGGTIIEDHVQIGPNTTFINTSLQPDERIPESETRTVIKNGASIGANATILPGLKVGIFARVEAGSVVTSNVPPYAIVFGNPAQIKGYSTTHRQTSPDIEMQASAINDESHIHGVKLYELPEIRDLRGSLSFAEYGEKLPFIPKRYFLIYDVPSKEVRGEHAHHTLHQFLICVRGSITVMVDDGKNRAIYELNQPNLGLHLPPMVWAAQYQAQDAVLLVLASDVYNSEDYIRDYNEFLEALSRKEAN
jgi:acetyltransferase-like isoleucine patch superfamily enzyme/dTDP-4-dehydrorhamnose 3,5-epimerase-like enzyme